MLPLEIPYVPNRTARLTGERGVILPMLEEQIDHSVLWRQSVEELLGKGMTGAVEFGPGRVLEGLGKRIAKGKGMPLEQLTVGDSAGIRILESKWRETWHG